MKLPTLPNLEGLIRLARHDGVDVRPTLVRVVTDMYVQKRGHTRDEEVRFIELASWLLSSVDSATRAVVAEKLAVYPEAPRAVVRRLAADEFEVAEPVLRRSPCLTSEDLLAITIECGSRHAEAIAARQSAAEAAQPFATPGEHDSAGDSMPMIAAVDASAEDIATEPPTTDLAESNLADSLSAGGARASARREDAPLGQLFLRGGGEERRQIIADLADGAAPGATHVAIPVDGDAIGRLEASALQERPENFARDLQQLLRISRTTADEIVGDSRGEPVVVAARAIGMKADVLLRVLLFLNPAIGQSVERVFDLMDFHGRVTPEAARSLVAGWRDPIASEKRAARYQSLHWDDEARVRRPTSDHAWRHAPQVSDGRAQPSRATEGVSTERRQRTT